MDEEQTADDLCLLHKGLAEFLIYEGGMFFQVWVFFLWRNGISTALNDLFRINNISIGIN